MNPESPWLKQARPHDALVAELLFRASPEAPFPEAFCEAWCDYHQFECQTEELRAAWNEWLEKGALNHVFIPVATATDAYCIPTVVQQGETAECFATFPEPENRAVRRLVDALFGGPAAPQPSLPGVAKACGIVARGSSWNLGVVCAMLHQLGWCFRPGPRPLHLVVSAALDDQLRPGVLTIKAVADLDRKFAAAKARFGEELLFVCSGNLAAKDACILNLEHGTPLPDALRRIFAAWTHASNQLISSLEDECVASQIGTPVGLKALLKDRHTREPRPPQDDLDLRILARIERLFVGGLDVIPECVSVTFKEAAVASQGDIRARIYEMAEWESARIDDGRFYENEDLAPHRFRLNFQDTPRNLPEDTESINWASYLETLCTALISASILPETLFNALVNCFELDDYEEAKPPLWRILDDSAHLFQTALPIGHSDNIERLFDLLFRIVFPLAFWDTGSTLNHHQTLCFLPLSEPPLTHRFPSVEQRRLVAWTVALWSHLNLLNDLKLKELDGCPAETEVSRARIRAAWEIARQDTLRLAQEAPAVLATLNALKRPLQTSQNTSKTLEQLKEVLKEEAMSGDCYHHLCVLSDCLRAQLLHDIAPNLPDFSQSFSTLRHVLTVLPRKQLARTRFLVEWILILAQRLRLLHHLQNATNCDNAPLDVTQQETQQVLTQLLLLLPSETDGMAYGHAFAPLRNRLLSISLPHC